MKCMSLPFSHHADQHLGSTTKQILSLLEAKLPVPTGFIVSPQTFDAFIKHNFLETKIHHLIERCNFTDLSDVKRVSTSIQQLILSSEIPQEVANELLSFVAHLNGSVMLTASPLFPSQSQEELKHTQRLFGISGEANILIALRHMWASLFSSELLYFFHLRCNDSFPSMSVCIQHFPKLQISGTLVTTDAGAGKHICRVEAVFGAGALIGHLQGSDTYVVNKQTDTEEKAALHPQLIEYHIKDGEPIIDHIAENIQERRKLSAGQIKKISLLAKNLQHHLFFPQEAVWIADQNDVYLISTAAISHAPIQQVEAQEKTSQKPLLHGTAISPGIITGKIRHVHTRQESLLVRPGEIAIAASFSSIDKDAYKHLRGLIIEHDIPEHDGIAQATRHGVTTLIAATDASTILKEGAFVTIHSPSGNVYAGGAPAQSRMSPVSSQPIIRSVTKVGVQLSLTQISSNTPVINGHMYCTGNEIIKKFGVHPLKLLHEHKERLLHKTLLQPLEKILKQTTDTSLLYRFADLTTHEYRTLLGGSDFETMREENPALGYHGSVRLLDIPDLMHAELEVIEELRRRPYGKRLSLVFPSLRTAYEVERWHTVLAAHHIERSASLRFVADISLPSCMGQLEEIVGYGVDALFLNLDTFATFFFGADHFETLRYEEPDIVAPLCKALMHVLTQCHDLGIQLILTGKLALNEDCLQLAVSHGVNEIIVPVSALAQIRERLVSLEAERIQAHV
ncbi:hypothetical protein C5B42_00385 [Candidatus Cerribacteria bacterium 'Amazon FNV 2010 28 9']|uniref:Phosphoenolpyruvate synthase n=1 Tax=Candidatus Cerribacteria bacterium 'Amazon FNV 2010 28 9' TaxID=2081795 RepID=A0A317JRM1_9BACT|nr:MAG: hypothetical protein C5B42_00385 [Candidatus Cerribacteria bacterium 'Amazon FNV 2010 28 9']